MRTLKHKLILVITALLVCGQTAGFAADLNAWKGVRVRTFDLTVDAGGPGYFTVGFACSMTTNGCHVVKVESSPGQGAEVRSTRVRSSQVRLDGKPGRRYGGIIYPSFSADGRSLVYVAARGTEEYVVFNEVEGPAFGWVYAETVVVSDNGKRVAYVAQTGAKVFLMVNEKAQKSALRPYRLAPFLSRDGSRCAFLTTDPVRRKYQFVVDDEAGPLHDGGKHHAYVAREAGRSNLVVDGKEVQTYERAELLSYSPDSERLALGVRQGKQWCIVVEGKHGPYYDSIENFSFSPNSKHVAYGATRKGELV